ncbi:hypothetical protein Gotur_033668 [Gossypium turneri]
MMRTLMELDKNKNVFPFQNTIM